MFETLIYGWIPVFARRRWGDVENPSWIQGLLMHPENIRSDQQAFWTVGMHVAEYAERFSWWIQRHYNESVGGEWLEILDGLDGGDK